MDFALASLGWLWAPVAAVGVSVMYFRCSENESFGERVAVSAHGVTLALLYAAALCIHVSGQSRDFFLPWYLSAFLVPVALGLFALLRFRGASAIHFLQLGNFIAGLWIAFVGVMAVTGNWL